MNPDTVTVQPGTRPEDRGWTSHDPIGAGAFGEVRRASHRDLEGWFALKRVPFDAGQGPRFVREVTALATLDHPAIVKVRDAGIDADGGWLVMDLAPGRPLLAFRARPPLPAAVVLAIGAQIADALAHAHARGVAHRDLKPANIIVQDDGTARLIDFGVARVEGELTLTLSGRAPVTPPYAPPEWFTDRQTDPRAADVYALGVVIYELLTGEPAFARCGLDELAEVKRATPGLRAPAPTEVQELILAMTSPNIVDRPTAAQVANALSGWPPLAVPADSTVAATPSAESSPSGLDARLGRYHVLRELGRGAVGAVFLAWDPLLGRHVAIKRLHSGDSSAVERFTREARTVAALDHPAIARVLDFGQDGAVPYFAMEFIDGPDLRARLTAGRPTPAEAVRWARQIAGALGAAHRADLVHRDVKPANILIDPAGDARLTDFGVALTADAARLTQTGQLVGSPLYMAPEQVQATTTDARTDIYGLGAVLYELLSGRPPYPADAPMVVFHRVLHESPDPLPLEVPPALRRIVRAAMARDPADRYPDMASFDADLARWETGEPIRVAAPRWRPSPRLRRGLQGVAGVAAVLGLIAAGWAGLQAWQSWSVEREALAQWRSVERAMARSDQAGNPTEADAAFEVFANLPEHRGTRALAQGWMVQADRLAQRQDRAGARDALARSWSEATHPDDQERALLALGQGFLADWDWVGLAGVVHALRPLNSTAAAPLRTALATARRDLDAALPSAGPAGPIIDRLRRASPLGWRAGDPHPIRLTGERDLWLVEADGVLSSIAPEARVAGPAVPWPEVDANLYWFLPLHVAGEPHLFGFSHDDGGFAALWELGPPARELLRWPSAMVLDAAVADLDGDGVEEIYFGTGFPERALHKLARGESGWAHVDAHPPTSASNSDVMAVLRWTADEVDPSSIFVKTSAWGGFDVRELRAGEQGLQMVNRRKLGAGWNLRALRGAGGPRLAAAVMGGEGSRQQWSRERPDGETYGIHLLKPDLSTERAIELPRSMACWTVYIGDIDGDGLDDLGVGCEDDAMIARQLPDGDFAPVWLANTRLHGLYDFDDDGRAEALLEPLDEPGAPRWVAGLGEDRLPIREVAPPPAPPPAQAGTATRAAWRRAEALIAMGLAREARRQLEAIAALDLGLVGAAALTRAGDLAVYDQSHAEAAALYARAARVEGAEQASARSAAAAWAADHRFAEAAEALAATGDPGQALARFRSLADAPRVSLDFQRGFPARDLYPDPVQAAFDASRGALRVRQTSEGPAVRLPLRFEGDRAGLEFDLTLERMEWGTTFDLGLYPAGGGPPRWSIRLQSRGGGGSVGTVVLLEPGTRYVCHQTDRGTADWGDRISGRLDYVASDRSALFVVEGLGVRCVERWTDERGALTGDWELRVGTLGRLTPEPTLLDVSVHRLEVVGATERAPDTPSPPGFAALAAGRPDLALATLEDPWARAIALEDLGRWPEAEAQLATAIHSGGEPARSARLPILLRTRPRLAPTIREALGPAWSDELLRTWRLSTQQHADDRGVHAALLAQMGPIAGATPAELASTLEGLRARAHRLAGNAELARAAADASLAHLERVDGLPTQAARPEVTRALVEAARVRANLEPDRAIDLLLRALELAASREVLADSLVVDAALRPLHTNPRWGEIDAARASPFAHW